MTEPTDIHPKPVEDTELNRTDQELIAQCDFMLNNAIQVMRPLANDLKDNPSNEENRNLLMRYKDFFAERVEAIEQALPGLLVSSNVEVIALGKLFEKVVPILNVFRGAMAGFLRRGDGELLCESFDLFYTDLAPIARKVAGNGPYNTVKDSIKYRTTLKPLATS